MLRPPGGWDEAFQGKRFRDQWEPSANQVVLLGSEAIGCLRVEEHDDHVFVDYIALMPEHQRHGIGAALLRQVQASAATRGVPVLLNVLKVNPARALRAAGVRGRKGRRRAMVYGGADQSWSGLTPQ